MREEESTEVGVGGCGGLGARGGGCIRKCVCVCGGGGILVAGGGGVTCGTSVRVTETWGAPACEQDVFILKFIR